MRWWPFWRLDGRLPPLEAGPPLVFTGPEPKPRTAHVEAYDAAQDRVVHLTRESPAAVLVHGRRRGREVSKLTPQTTLDEYARNPGSDPPTYNAARVAEFMFYATTGKELGVGEAEAMVAAAKERRGGVSGKGDVSS
jgi:hypothetical protein